MPRAFRSVLALVLCLFSVSLAGAKDFDRSQTAATASRIEAELQRAAASANEPARVWNETGIAAIRAGEWRAAMNALSVAIGLDPANESSWRNYAVALLRVEPQDWEERYNLPQKAEAAAYKAYQLAEGPQAEARALALLADAYERRELYRPAIDAVKVAVDLAGTAGLRDRYASLREQHGFRMIDYKVDADAASPRVCVEFSEPLRSGRVDFAPYVTVGGIEQPAVTAEGSQICVDGLKHGEHYNLTLRRGVPSEIGEILEKPVELAVYVRDRSPSVRFTGRNYVLPSRGQNGIPVVSVNVAEIEGELYRVSDRGLAPSIISGSFQQQLSGEALNGLRESTGIKVWSGRMETENRLNEDVTTAFPVSEAAGALEPGVYVLIAWRTDVELDYWDQRATQWFVVSDLGISSISTGDGIHAVVRSLATAAPVEGARLELVARSNEVLGTASTGPDGVAHFAGGLTRGGGGAAPALLVARSGESDYAFLDLTQSPFDLTDRGVEGRAAPGPLDAFLTTERGVYRSGETVYVTALLRDAAGKAVPDLPLTFIVSRPDGAEDRRAVVGDAGAGGRTLDIALLDTAATGTWRVRAYADVKAAPVGEATFLVEDYVPERLDLELEANADALRRGEPVTVRIDGRWLYGAPAAELAVEGEITVAASTAPVPGFPGYAFGLSDETFTAVREPLAPAVTGPDGRAQLDVALPQLPATTRALQARTVVRLREPGGRAVERTITFPVKAEGPRIGVRPLFDGAVGEGATATFDVVAIDPDGSRVALPGAKWELLRVNRRYQWYQDYGRWQSQVVTSTRRVAGGDLALGTDGIARIAAAVEWGEYRLDVMTADPAGPATSVTFHGGWNASATADTPDMLSVALDKESYAPGETAQLRIEAPFDGKATIALIGEQVKRVIAADVTKGDVSLPIEVTGDLGAGVYVVASLARPLDEAASRMPGRAIGLVWLSRDSAPVTLDVALNAPERAKPRETLTLPLRLANLASGETAYVTVAAVDVGILNLTGFESPRPTRWYYGQRMLGAELRDLYGQLIDGMRADRGRLRSGGDMAGLSPDTSAPTQKPLALFSGIVPVGENGEAEVSFDLPGFNGTIRLMAVAWSGAKVGEASADVIVADPVVITASTPRFLAFGDRSRLHLDVSNVSGASGAHTLRVTAEGAVGVEGEAERTLDLAPGARAALELPLTTAGMGAGTVAVAVTAPDGAVYEQWLALDVQPPYPSITRRSKIPLAAGGGSATLDLALVADMLPGAAVNLSVDPLASLDIAGRLRSLDLYPYGCSEQITSRAMPMLYLSELDSGGVYAGVPVDERLRDAVKRVLARQDSGGGFGLWSPGGSDLWLNAYVLDFLTRARDKGIEVPARAIEMGMERLRNTLNYDDSGEGVAYAHYVLARNGQARLGDLRYLVDSGFENLSTPLARAQIGAALALLGDRTRAARAFAAAGEVLEGEVSWHDYGGGLRDGAAILALAAESDSTAAAIVPAVSRRIDTLAAGRNHFSTQENAWMVLAARALKARAADIRLDVGGSAHEGALLRSLTAAQLGAAPLTIANRGKEAAELVVTVIGAPREAEPAQENGFQIERRYYTLDGAEADPARVAQNERLVAVLTVTQSRAPDGQVLIVDHLPAGFEIDNPRLVTSGDVKALGWLPEDSGAAHAEFRDDRFVAAFDPADSDTPRYTAAYVVRAVSPGTFAHPPATVEDMYNPEHFARTGTGTVEVTAGR